MKRFWFIFCFTFLLALSGVLLMQKPRALSQLGEPSSDMFSLLGQALSSFSTSPAISPLSSPAFSTVSSPPSRARLISYCASDVALYDPVDVSLCGHPPKLNEFRLFEINLSRDRILFYENGLVRATLPLAYQAPYEAWYQTPTGYFRLGVKREKFMSSIAPVFMEKAIQLYEDFFIHAIPYYEDGTRVTSQFSGGCIRLEDDVAKTLYDLVQKGDPVVSYVTLDGLTPLSGFSSPVDSGQFWVRQRFNAPLKTDYRWHEDKRDNYIQHAGVDLAPHTDATDMQARSVHAGTVVRITRNGQGDAGLGNSIIVEHIVDQEKIYSLYGHLASIDRYLRMGDRVVGGQVIGTVGSSGYGCDFWRIGEDGCTGTGAADVHLHFEVKTKPVLESPEEDTCSIDQGKRATRCVGYSSHHPQLVGYRDPLQFVFGELISQP